MKSEQKNEYLRGIFFALLAYFSWGTFPLFWKQLSHVTALEILSHRIIWSFIFMFLLCLLQKIKIFPLFKDIKLILKLFLCGSLMCVNWGLYIWAVNNGHIIESSLGYYINPLESILIGLIFFKEKLNKSQIAAIVMACAGVAYFTITHGSLPWISIVLGLSFAIYGAVKKTLQIKSTQGLTIETMLMTPLALLYVTGLFRHHSNFIFNDGILTTSLLIGGGIVTALPLLWFGIAAPRLPLNTIGFIQYISPSLQLLIGVNIYGENFTHAHVVCFTCIWIGLAIYSIDMIKRYRKSKNTIKI